VVVVGPGDAKEHHGKYGYPVAVDQAISAVDAAAQFDAVVVPGGYAPDRMRRHAGMVGLHPGDGPPRQDRGRHLSRPLDAGTPPKWWPGGKPFTCFFAIKGRRWSMPGPPIRTPRWWWTATSSPPGSPPTCRPFLDAIITALGGEVAVPRLPEGLCKAGQPRSLAGQPWDRQWDIFGEYSTGFYNLLMNIKLIALSPFLAGILHL